MYKGFRIPVLLMFMFVMVTIFLPTSVGGNVEEKSKVDKEGNASTEDPPDFILMSSILENYRLISLNTVDGETTVVKASKVDDKPKKKKKKPKPVDQLVKEVEEGKHGDGDKRKKSLGPRYDEVQKVLNKKYKSKPEVKSVQVESQSLHPTVKNEPSVTTSTSSGKYGNELTSDQYEILLAVVQQESGGQDYTATLAVVSVIINRVNSDKYQNDVWSVVTAPGQFEAYGAGHYHRRMGNITDITKQAVHDGLNGKTNVSYLNFWEKSHYSVSGRSDSNKTTIGGNTFFNFQ